MSHQLILELPNEIFDPLAANAKLSGATPEQLAIDWLTAMSRHAANDPIEKWIGALPSSVPDWTSQHENPDEAVAFINEIMADDDAKDPYLQSYQHFGKQP